MKRTGGAWFSFGSRVSMAATLIASSFVAVIVVLLATRNAEAIVGKRLSQAEVSQLQTAALNGDGLAAQKLSWHFGITENKREADYWFQIAVENDDPSAKQNFASQLWLSGGLRNCTRALHLYDEVMELSKGKSESEFFKLTREQRDDMRKSLPKCIARPCSKTVEGAWCD